MEILQYKPSLLKPVIEFYNELIAEVPHCYPVEEEDFTYAMRSVIGQSDVDDDDFKGETAFVAICDGSVKAFVHVGYEDENGNGEKVYKGVIRFLGYQRGERKIGQAILNKAEDYFKDNNVSRIVVFSKIYRYNFYHFEYAELSDTLDHIHGLLGINEYQSYHGQVFLDWQNYKVNPPSINPSIELRVEWKDGRGKLPNCHIKAYKDGEEIGECWNVSCGQFSSHPDVQDWVYTDWIGVEDDYQGEGLGKYLLQSSLHEMHRVGYKHAALSTDWDNNRALLFYSNFGYRAVDWTYAYQKTLLSDTKNEVK